MKNRREFVKTAGAIGVGLTAAPSVSFGNTAVAEYPSKRPAPAERNFTSEAVEKVIGEMKQKIKDPKLAWMFSNCFPNTIDTTVTYREKNGKPDTFVITGDIHAMWLRDSSAQVWPYLPLINEDKKLKNMVAGLINRQAECIRIDPYANAFNDGKGHSEWMTDKTDMKPELHERKWEIDSLCYPIRLGYHYWKQSGDASPFGNEWKKAMEQVVKTFRVQQRKEGRGPYYFMRKTFISTDTMPGRGWGNPIRPNGLICSGFRPSDDATTYLFLVPSNYFAMVSLRQLAEMSKAIYHDNAFAEKCTAFADEVEQALKEHAVFEHEKHGKILSFEVDGFGNTNFMDDANVPSLLALPYLEAFKPDDPLYHRTRNFVLSEDNPWFWKGKAAEGIGGPHVGLHYVWPMAIIMRAMTSNDKEEIAHCIKMLRNTDAGTGFMHESFNKDNPEDFTRKWFAWANTLFGELLMKVDKEHPELLQRNYA